MKSDAEQRAEHRRKNWQAGVATGQAARDLDLAFWSAATGEQKLEAVWQLAVDYFHMTKDGHGSRAGLQGPAAGVRRR